MGAVDVHEVVVTEIASLLKEGGRPVPQLRDEDVLLETGLDSLGIAVLATRLEDSLGYDPFVKMDRPIYPQTVGELTEIYRRFAPSDNA
ncbi:acyl carrier protein [Pseudonocardia nigra]|uniref:acyl carrier protein n=1 Tax=Pseudonocardia nigra TaxID=1921578 RepID=UPI001C5F74FF|nr:acyl carrier protein [Pseudonocardia nigra]